MPLSTIQSETAITHFIDSKGEPPRLENIQRIKTNIPFQSPPSNQFNNLFPYGDLDIASIHVAVQVSLSFMSVLHTRTNCFIYFICLSHVN